MHAVTAAVTLLTCSGIFYKLSCQQTATESTEQSSHTSWKVAEFFSEFSKAWNCIHLMAFFPGQTDKLAPER